jgi:hypothetical protein
VDEGFNHNINREFVSKDAYNETVLRTPAYQEYKNAPQFNNNNKLVTGMQQGGQIQAMAKKYGIPYERALELMQQGGEVQEEQMSNPQEEQGELNPQEVVAKFAEAMQQDPQVIMQQLQQMQPEEQQQAIEQMMQTLQGEQAVAQQGGDFFEEGGKKKKSPYIQNSTLIKDFTNAPSVLERLPYTPRENNPNDIWKGDNYGNVWKPLVNESTANKDMATKIDSWLMANKDTFSPNIKKQLEGLEGDARIARIQKLATDEKPGPFHNAVLDAIKSVKEEEAVKKDVPEYDYGTFQDQGEVKPYIDNTQGFTPYITPPDPRQAVPFATSGNINFERSKRALEPGQVAISNNLDTQREQLIASGLSPQIQAAMLANANASAMEAQNANIASVEQYNAQNQQQVNNMQANANYKNDLMNLELRDKYAVRNIQAKDNEFLANKMYNDTYNTLGYRTQQDNFNRSLANASFENYKINRDGTLAFTPPPKSSYTAGDNTARNKAYEDMTAPEQEAEKLRQIEEMKKKKADGVNNYKKSKIS